uniref:Cytochrome P450 n=2 Tax=Stomoxys calcitrans TaxID=35570 RepID=A0A1I8Q986_STOCA
MRKQILNCGILSVVSLVAFYRLKEEVDFGRQKDMAFSTNFLLIAIIVASTYFLWSKRRFLKVFKELPGPGPPLLGIAYRMLKAENFMRNMEEEAKSYQAPFITWLGPSCFLYVNDPQTMEIIFNSPLCTNKGDMYRFMANAIGDGLFTSSSPRWNKHRRLLNPAFGRKSIQTFLPIFNDEANAFVNKLKGMQDQSLEIYKLLKKSVLEISCQTTMGKKMNFQNDNSTVIFDSYNSLTEICITRMLSPWLHPDVIYQCSSLFKREKRSMEILSKFVRDLLQLDNGTTIPKDTSANVESFKNIARNCDEDDVEVIGKSKPHIFVEQVHALIESGQLSVADVLAEANVTVAATFETTSTAMYFTCLALAMHPQCQEKLYMELVNVLPTGGSQDITIDQLDRLVYTEMAINEAMRLFAPVPAVVRSASSDFHLRHYVTGKTTLIPRGTQIILDIFNMQRSEQIWGKRARYFDPDEHFGPACKPHPFAFVPFTKGLRMCIGYRYALTLMKVMLAKIFRNYRVLTKTQMKDLKIKGTISLKLGDYPLCTLEPREV